MPFFGTERPRCESTRWSHPSPTGAVSETLGGAGILVHEKRLDEIAELAALLVTDEALRERVVAGQDRVLQRVLSRNDDELLLRFVDEVAASEVTPRRGSGTGSAARAFP
jgi:hypothetical protein